MASIHKALEASLPESGISGDMYITEKGKIFVVNNSGELQLITDRETLDSLYLSKEGDTVNGTLNVKDIIPSTNSESDLGSLTNRFRTLYTTNAVNVSDKSFKDDIKYIKDAKPYYDFINNAEFAKFRYKSDDIKRSDLTVGFIANDFDDNGVGSDIVFKENDVYNFSMYSYVTTIALALKESISKIECLEKELEEHRILLEKYKSK